MVKIVEEFENIINKYSWENHSNTPDFILAEHLYNCLVNFSISVNKREKWYGRVVKYAKTD